MQFGSAMHPLLSQKPFHGSLERRHTFSLSTLPASLHRPGRGNGEHLRDYDRPTTPANSWYTLGWVDGSTLIVGVAAPSLPDERHALLLRDRLGIHPGAPPLSIGSSRPDVTRVHSPGPRDRRPPRGRRGPQPSAIEKGPPRTIRPGNWVNRRRVA